MKSQILNSVKKIAAMSMIVFLNWSGLSAVIQTFAYFNDTEISTGNILSAGTLDISLSPSGVYTSGLLYPTDSAEISIGMDNDGTLPIQYTSKIVPLTADTSPCDYVSLDATDGTQTYFSVPLLGFTSSAETPSGPVSWNYKFTIDPLAPPSVWSKTCYFKWVFTAWSKDSADPASGFFDIEEKSGGIRIGKTIVLNEILANPIGSDSALKPAGEWVELYNNSNISFDVAGWALYDSDDSHKLYIASANTNTGGTIIPSHGFLVVYRNGEAGFTIDDSNETIRLYTGYPISSSVVLVDSYSWITEKPEGSSYARIPDGVGNWVDPIPTPGESNEIQTDESIRQLENSIIVDDLFVSSKGGIVDIIDTTNNNSIEQAPATEESQNTEENSRIGEPVATGDAVVANDLAEESQDMFGTIETEIPIEEQPAVVDSPIGQEEQIAQYGTDPIETDASQIEQPIEEEISPAPEAPESEELAVPQENNSSESMVEVIEI